MLLYIIKKNLEQTLKTLVSYINAHLNFNIKVQPKRATPDKVRYKQTNVEFDATLDKACEGKRSIFIGALRDNISEEDLESYFSGIMDTLQV